MDLPSFMRDSASTNIKTIEMHTTGEPTRIVYSGFPDLTGTLLEQRALAKDQHDHIRRALICEPRGHQEMYGAVLRPRTEFTDSGKADMGVLFLTNEGYSTMCGHATLAVSRMLVDHAGAAVSSWFLPTNLGGGVRELDLEKKETYVNLHVPSGVVRVTVPIAVLDRNDGRFKTDTSRSISYLSVPSYATGISVPISISRDSKHYWPELENVPSAYDTDNPAHTKIKINVAYGGAFYIIVPAKTLGFSSLTSGSLHALREATRKLKAYFNLPNSADLRRKYLHHPEHKDLQFLYSVIVTEPDTSPDSETGLCFFAN